MNILLIQKSDTLIEAIKNVLKEFQTCKIELKSSILSKYDKIKIEQKIKKNKPDILIIDEFYLKDQVEEVSYLLNHYPRISSAVIISNLQDRRLIKECTKYGISNFIPKDSSHKFYNELFIFLNKEHLKREIEKIIVDIVHLKERK